MSLVVVCTCALIPSKKGRNKERAGIGSGSDSKI